MLQKRHLSVNLMSQPGVLLSTSYVLGINAYATSVLVLIYKSVSAHESELHHRLIKLLLHVETV